MDAPQAWHTVHASITQADAIGSLLVNADGLTCSNVGPHAAEPKIALEAKTNAVEHADAQGASQTEGNNLLAIFKAPPNLIDNDRLPQRCAPSYPPCKTKD
jgi:hypothetical protein